jgi:hypothetical protein
LQKPDEPDFSEDHFDWTWCLQLEIHVVQLQP